MPLWLRNRIFSLAYKPLSVPLNSHSFYSLLHPFSVIKQFSSVAQSCPTLCDPMDCSTPGHPVHHQLPEFTQTHVHWVGDAIQSSRPVSSPSPPVFYLSQHQGLFQWVGSWSQNLSSPTFPPVYSGMPLFLNIWTRHHNPAEWEDPQVWQSQTPPSGIWDSQRG